MGLLAHTILSRPLLRIRRQRIFALSDAARLRALVGSELVHVRPVRANDVRRASDVRESGVVAAFERMLSDGQLGVYAWRSAEVVGHAWAVLCRAGRMRANGYFALTEREALIHYCFVSPVHRGVAIYPLMLQTLSRLLFASHGIHRVLVDSECTNLPSLRGIAKAGFQPVATGTYVMFGGRLLLERVRPWGGDVG